MLGLGRMGAGVQPVTDDVAWKRLVDALRQQESSGGKPLVSKKGAMGSLQLMPGTADEMLKALGRRDVLSLPPRDRYQRVRYDRGLNEELGQEYLRQQLQKFGHPALALAAYNGGGANVRQWLKRFGDPRKGEISWGQWVEKIPFGETRAFVKTITRKAGLPLDPPPVPERKPDPWGADEPLVAQAPSLFEPAPIFEPPPPSRLSQLLGVPPELAEPDPLYPILRRV